VINIARSHNATQARVHQAGCRTICGPISVGSTWTGPYVKVCAEHLAELEQWAIETPGQPISPCGICRPASGAAQPTSTKDRERMSGGRVYALGAVEHTPRSWSEGRRRNAASHGRLLPSRLSRLWRPRYPRATAISTDRPRAVL